MSHRAVYDTMVFFQWAALGQNRQHATVKALYDGSVHLCMSQALLEEVRDVLYRPELRERAPNLTPDRVKQVLAAIVELSEWVADVPNAFTWTRHPDDDHIFNLAIAAKADFLVTWENRMHALATEQTEDAGRLRAHAPQLQIITPVELARRLASERADQR
ncbi:MAG TPA: putative toxin-antitoxin system toxin component, PIN family [Humisphaera sp.]|jgi:putative PIN family toxin of toxin-antitoxin system|nr:putative toxin-antitoxin system toxin component, PIN family [Humisphaera sp.]